MIVRESTCSKNLNDIRPKILLISPDASPTAAASRARVSARLVLAASRVIVPDFLRPHHQIGELVDDNHDV